MCGRFVLRVSERQISQTFDVPEPMLPFDVPPRYNIAPSQQVLAIRQRTAEADREAVLLKWGLVPSWAKDPKIGYKHINARSESVAEKPAFRSALRNRRCLVAADGFFEWKEGKQKKPFLFTVGEGRVPAGDDQKISGSFRALAAAQVRSHRDLTPPTRGGNLSGVPLEFASSGPVEGGCPLSRGRQSLTAAHSVDRQVLASSTENR